MLKFLAYGENGPWEPGEVAFRYVTTDILVQILRTDLKLEGYDEVLQMVGEPLDILCTAEIFLNGFIARWWFDDWTAEKVVKQGRLFTTRAAIDQVFPSFKDYKWLSGTTPATSVSTPVEDNSSAAGSSRSMSLPNDDSQISASGSAT